MSVTKLVSVITKLFLTEEKPSFVLTKAFFVREKMFLIDKKIYFSIEKKDLIFESLDYALKIAVNPQGEINMPIVQIKRIKEKVVKILNAWLEGASAVTEFRNTKKLDFETRIAQAQALENEIADLKAQTSMKEDERDDVYRQLDADAVDIRKGVEGHKDYGDDSPLYGSMGFVRKSERKTGLTRKTKAVKDK